MDRGELQVQAQVNAKYCTMAAGYSESVQSTICDEGDACVYFEGEEGLGESFDGIFDFYYNLHLFFLSLR